MKRKIILTLLLTFTAVPALADATADLAQAASLKEQGEVDQAVQAYQQIADANRGTDQGLEAMRNIILLQIHSEKTAEALTAYEQLMADYSNHANLVDVLNDSVASEFRERDEGDRQTALEIYEYMIAAQPDSEYMMGWRCSKVKCYIGLGDDTNAETETARLFADYANDPGLPDIVYELAYEYRSFKKWADSRTLLEHYVTNWPQGEKAMRCARQAAKAGIKLGDYEKADQSIESMISTFGSDPGIGYEVSELADDFAEQREYDRAVSLYAQVVETWPENKWAVEAQTRLARMYIQIGDAAKAAEATEKLKKDFANSPTIAASLENVGDMYQLNYSQRQAYAVYKYVLEQWPAFERAIHVQMKAILAQVRLQDLDQSEAELASLLNDFADHKDLPAMVHEVVEEYRDNGLYEEGRGLFAYIIENWEQDEGITLELQVGLALQSIKLKDDPNTEAAIDRLIADYNDHPNIAKALSQIAEEYLYAKNYQRAIELWELTETDYAKYAFPSKDEVPYLLATCYKRLQEYDRAIEYYEQMLQRYPRNKFAYRVPYRLGMIYMREKDDYETAVYWYAKQNELYDNELLGSRALRHQGSIYAHKLEDYESAKQCFEKYLADYPNGASIWGMTCNLARCHEKLGNPKEAVRFYRQALGTTTEPDLIDKTREKLAILQEGEEQ